MNEDDFELERLKAKRLAEMQKNISTREIPTSTESVKATKTENPRDLLINILGYRGLEVLQNAESQFPNETKIILEKLSELIKIDEINETIDGGKLLALFRSVGLNIRMETKINVEQDGKFVSLTDKLSKQSSKNSDEE
ncbi:MAG: DNA-binding protein [Nitrosopumilus sp.]